MCNYECVCSCACVLCVFKRREGGRERLKDLADVKQHLLQCATEEGGGVGSRRVDGCRAETAQREMLLERHAAVPQLDLSPPILGTVVPQTSDRDSVLPSWKYAAVIRFN